MEVVTKKRMQIFSGRGYPEVALDVADPALAVQRVQGTVGAAVHVGHAQGDGVQPGQVGVAADLELDDCGVPLGSSFATLIINIRPRNQHVVRDRSTV
jgi:hypothetical protein